MNIKLLLLFLIVSPFSTAQWTAFIPLWSQALTFAPLSIRFDTTYVLPEIRQGVRKDLQILFIQILKLPTAAAAISSSSVHRVDKIKLIWLKKYMPKEWTFCRKFVRNKPLLTGSKSPEPLNFRSELNSSFCFVETHLHSGSWFWITDK